MLDFDDNMNSYKCKNIKMEMKESFSVNITEEYVKNL